MQCYTELTPPTAVTHAVTLPFLSPTSNNLIVAKTSLLQIFEIKRVTPSSTGKGDPSDSRLSLIAEYPLAGTVTALSPVQLSPDATKTGGASALLCAFKDAKLSLIEWDPEQHKISTISIHYYEGENVTMQPFGPSLAECESILTVDPGSRCAALKFGPRGLAILPFRQSADDLVEEDDMDGVVSQPSAGLKRSATGLREGGEEARQTPYKASFVLPLTALDPGLTQPVHLAFLHEYREPTFGILSASTQPSTALLDERKDLLAYNVFTLDLEQRASTNLVSVLKLPSDLWKVVSLPLPVGGALLVGTNEFIHVDQGGKTNAVAVNAYAGVASDFAMVDQSSLDLKLEGCSIGPLDVKFGTLLVALQDGSAVILSFHLLGRSVGGLNVTSVGRDQGGFLVGASPSCIAGLNARKIFVGSEEGDSLLIEWNKTAPTLSRKRSHAQMLEEAAAAEDDEDADDLDDDDLYATAAETTKKMSSSGLNAAESPSTYSFKLCDTLPSLAPINNVCFGRSSATPKDKLDLIAGIGRGRASRLAFLSREVPAEVVRRSSLDGIKAAWSLRAGTKGPSTNAARSNEDDLDNMLFVCDGESTKAYDIVPPSGDASGGAEPSLVERTGTEFEHEGETLAVSTLGSGARIVQCRRSEIRTYEAGEGLGLSQIIPMLNEETDEELSIVHVHFADPYALVIREDSSIIVLQVDKSGDIEPLDLPEESAATKTKWLSGCLYAGPLTTEQHVAFLLGEEGALRVFALPKMNEIYGIPTLSTLRPVFGADSATQRRGGGSRETLTEILMAPLGARGIEHPYLIVRSASDEITLYEPFHSPSNVPAEETSWTTNLCFRKAPFTHIPSYTTLSTSEDRPQPLRSMRLGRWSAVVVPGAFPALIMREHASTPAVFGLRSMSEKMVQMLLPLNHQACSKGFGLVNTDGEMQECRIPDEMEISTGWCVRRSKIGASPDGEEVRHLAFHEERGVYVVATCRGVDFQLPEGEGAKHNYDREDDAADHFSPLPQVPLYTLHLLSASDLTTIHTFSMPYLEVIAALKIMPLEISEHTHEHALRIVVGSTALRGEDMPTKGAITVFEVLDVVPDPAHRASSGYKLNVVAREETKGAVTTIESFPGGLIGTTQGQKILIRGLREDGSCLPVAFLDGQCIGTTLKSLPHAGLWLAGDAWKGLWLGAWTEEPYKLSILGKSHTRMPVMHAEFLPFDGHLHLVIADAASNIHILQYDPENPKSLSGTRLLHRGSFHTAHSATSMTLLPSCLAPPSEQQQQLAHTNGDAPNVDGDNSAPPPPATLSHLLLTTAAGSLALLTPLDEPASRRLSALQTHLLSVLDPAGGLNPRAFRAAVGDSHGVGSMADDIGAGPKGILDGGVLRRVTELGVSRRGEVLGRAGMDGWGWWSDAEVIGVGGRGGLAWM